MIEDIIGNLIYLYFSAWFASAELDTLLRSDIEQMIEWNRGLAKGLLALGCVTLLPLTLSQLGLLVAFLCGQASLFGLETEMALTLNTAALFVAQLICVGLLTILCIIRLEWEPRGFVFALADLLHTTPRVLQNCCRAHICLPLISLVLVIIL